MEVDDLAFRRAISRAVKNAVEAVLIIGAGEISIAV